MFHVKMPFEYRIWFDFTCVLFSCCIFFSISHYPFANCVFSSICSFLFIKFFFSFRLFLFHLFQFLFSFLSEFLRLHSQLFIILKSNDSFLFILFFAFLFFQIFSAREQEQFQKLNYRNLTKTCCLFIYLFYIQIFDWLISLCVLCIITPHTLQYFFFVLNPKFSFFQYLITVSQINSNPYHYFLVQQSD